MKVLPETMLGRVVSALPAGARVVCSGNCATPDHALGIIPVEADWRIAEATQGLLSGDARRIAYTHKRSVNVLLLDGAEHLRHLIDDLLDLSRADITSKRPGRRRSLLEQISGLSGAAGGR